MEDLDAGFVEKVAARRHPRRRGELRLRLESREHAPISIKAAGVSVVIAKSFARIFYRNAINTGLPIMESPEAVDGIRDGDEVDVDADTGTITERDHRRRRSRRSRSRRSSRTSSRRAGSSRRSSAKAGR